MPELGGTGRFPEIVRTVAPSAEPRHRSIMFSIHLTSARIDGAGFRGGVVEFADRQVFETELLLQALEEALPRPARGHRARDPTFARCRSSVIKAKRTTSAAVLRKSGILSCVVDGEARDRQAGIGKLPGSIRAASSSIPT